MEVLEVPVEKLGGLEELLAAVVVLVAVQVAVQAAVVQVDPEEVVVTQEGVENMAMMMTTPMMTVLTSEESPARLASPQDSQWQEKSHGRVK